DVNVPAHLLNKDLVHQYDKHCIVKDIDKFYCDIVNALKTASSIAIPMQKKNFYKFWWDQELSILKDKSINSHKVWSEAGRPRAGLLFDNMNRDKKTYKYTIKSK